MKSLIIVIVLAIGLAQSASIRKEKRAAVGPVWSSKKIPYAFSNIIEFDFDDRALIKNVLQQIQESLSVNGELCIEFVERTNEKDYILFVDKNDCSSGIGFFPGINNISLSKSCIKTGTIIHEVLHRLGFDHEHSRHDRDENIFVHLNNSISSLSANFEKNSLSSSTDLDAPYDFHSVIHYNSDALQKKDREHTITSKIPVLLSEQNEIYHSREKLTPIDIYKVQKFYKCPTIPKPNIVKMGDMIEAERLETITNRFKLEAELKMINEEVIGKYLAKTYDVCGIDHYWPLNYPIVENNHNLYKLMCIRKKQVKESCKFSLECIDERAVCLRPFLWPTGFCVRPENDRLNTVVLTANDYMVKFGKKVKETYGKVKDWFKPPTSLSQQQ